MEAVFILVGLVIALVVFDVMAWFWSYDSREPFDSAEWERRRLWRS